MSKQTKAEAIKQFNKQEKKEYTIKVMTLVKVIVLSVLVGVSFVAGWVQRSNFESEVRSEVRTQMSVLDSKS